MSRLLVLGRPYVYLSKMNPNEPKDDKNINFKRIDFHYLSGLFFLKNPKSNFLHAYLAGITTNIPKLRSVGRGHVLLINTLSACLDRLHFNNFRKRYKIFLYQVSDMAHEPLVFRFTT